VSLSQSRLLGAGHGWPGRTAFGRLRLLVSAAS
jgi:hypothetical protein